MRKSYRWYIVGGLLILTALLLMALLAEHITVVSPDYQDRNASVLAGNPPFAPSSRHPLGTDQYGRDVWSRVAYGARWSLLFAAIVATIRLAIALPMGMWGGFGSRPIRWLTERLYAFTSSIPLLLLYLLLLSSPLLRLVGLWTSAAIMGTLLSVLEWPRIAIWVQSRTEHLLQLPFAEGAVAVGATPGRIFRRHLLPHLWPSVMQTAAREMSRSLLVMAELGIFGIMMGGGYLDQIEVGARIKNLIVSGVPEWGGVLADARAYALTAPWIVLAPAAAFFLAIIGTNLLAHGIGHTPLRSAASTAERKAVPWRSLVAGLTAVSLLLAYHPWSRAGAPTPCAVGGTVGQSTQRGYHVDVNHFYDPNDASLGAIGYRQSVNYLATAADRGFEQMTQLLGAQPGDRRPVVRLFPLPELYTQALQSAGVPAGAGGYVQAGANGCVYVSPKFLESKDSVLAQRAIAMELGKSMVGPDAPLSPVTTGLLVRATDVRPGFRIEYKAMIGAPLLSLPELFGQRAIGLEPGAQSSFMAQSAVLVEFLKKQLTADQLQQLSQTRAGLAEVARMMGMDEATLTARYAEAAYAMLADESVLTVPVGYSRIPKALEDAVRAGHEADRVLLDAEMSQNGAVVYVLDRSKGRTEVLKEFWGKPEGEWRGPLTVK
ncbi:MAG: ABC transporter permease [Mycobacterium leprae]